MTSDPRRMLIAATVIFMFAGCSEEPSADGKPLSHWVQILKTDPDPSQRLVAILTLKEMGPAARSALPDVQRAMKDSYSSVRIVALGAYANIAGPEGELSPLLEALRGEDLEMRKSAALVLVPSGKAAVPALIEALRSNSDLEVLRLVRESLLHASLRWGKEATPLLASLLRDPDPRIREAAAESLEGLGAEGKEALEAIQRQSRDAHKP